VRPELVAEVKFLTWTDENLLRQVVYEGLREDKPAAEVRRPVPYPKAEPPRRAPRPAGRQRSKRLPVPPENILQLLPDAVVPSREELARYWVTVADDALRYLGRRPLKLVRHVKGTTFYHMGPLPEIPPAVKQLRIEKRKGGTGTRLWVEDLAGLLGLVEIGAAEIHPWGARVEEIEHPDTLIFDLDPGEGVEWGFVVETAVQFRDLLAADGLDCWPKTTGGKGLHVMVSIEPDMDWARAHLYTRRLAERMAATAPDRYITSAALEARPGRLFIDYLRNGRGTTAIGAYSPRARPGFPVAAPVSWQQIVHGVRSDAFSIESPPRPDTLRARRAPRAQNGRRRAER
jgi:bifunctional non-homologous end joining protein LigD